MRSLRDILPRTLEDLGIAERVRQERTAQAWRYAIQDLADDLVAGTFSVLLRQKQLTVTVRDRRVAERVVERQAELVEALNARLGGGAVENVLVAVAPPQREE
ncbi:MAG: DUF721 domain-containing protein [Chloroflexi bacterium]|nr:DUF721 domain-containing protein [Chloroflexota bacterium]